MIIGIIGVCVNPPVPHIIKRTPTPLNTDIVYTNKNGDCYVYKKKKVKCNKEAKNIL